jgi:hypothetical protein
MRGASQELEAARRGAENRRLTVDSARRKLTDDIAVFDGTNRRLNAATEQREVQAKAWRNGGMSGDPDPSRLEAAILEAINRLQALADLSARQRQLTAGYRRRAEDETLRGIERRIQQQSAGSGPHARTEQPRAAVSSATANLDRAQAVRSRMDELVSKMQSMADDYASESWSR